ncbi:aromatic acid exporter family protein [Bacillus alkalicellulosilyticus]|uniref:aromatic acid exporter family protein n=1 Tax=Alkalihalobacterium alkalicellulosilyticum TaxID=1912214 RepID=UPI00099692D9|nr:aromatic acid exporter family protein [Bacillus alkalicellulosilyticus]
MFRIGYRTIKTAVGAGIAIGLAQVLNLDFYASAAILAILCISVTRKKSLELSWERFLACIVGLAMGALFFEVIGYNPIALAILLLLFIPLAVKLKTKEGIVTSSVIILHLYTLETVSVAIILNELLLIIIGIGVALLMNLYMPSVEKDLHTYQEQIEANFKTILFEMSHYLRHEEKLWDGKEVTETYTIIQTGKDIALKNIENHVVRFQDEYYHYFKMREKQFEIIERILPFVSSVQEKVIQADTLADYFEELSQAVTPKNRGPHFLVKLEEMRVDFREMELPKTRKEFETRSALRYIMHELEQYLLIKQSLAPSQE